MHFHYVFERITEHLKEPTVCRSVLRMNIRLRLPKVYVIRHCFHKTCAGLIQILVEIIRKIIRTLIDYDPIEQDKALAIQNINTISSKYTITIHDVIVSFLIGKQINISIRIIIIDNQTFPSGRCDKHILYASIIDMLLPVYPYFKSVFQKAAIFFINL